MSKSASLFSNLGAKVLVSKTKENTRTVYYDLMISDVYVGNLPAKKNKKKVQDA